MKVSIITIAYNAAETIEETIRSVISQDYHDIEYILIDGASQDKTLEIAQQYVSGIAKIISEPDEGIYDAMNKGVRNATGDLIGILNADDVFAHREVISRVVETMKAGNTDACYADLEYVSRENPGKVVRYWKSGQYVKSAFLNGWMPPHPTFFLKKELYFKYGVYRTALRSSADYELMLRMLYKFDVKTSYLPEVVVHMKLGGQSNVSLRNRLRANNEDRLAWKLNELKPERLTFIKKPLGKISQFFRR